MTRFGRCVPAVLLATLLGVALPARAPAQRVVHDTERLDFDRPESRGMDVNKTPVLRSIPGRRGPYRILRGNR